MAPSGRRKDLIDGGASTQERVRKMEIMHQTRTIVPLEWRPTRDDLDVIVDLIALMGMWQSNARSGDGDFPLSRGVGEQAMYLYGVMLDEGWDSPALAQDWTQFLYRFGAIPNLLAYGPILADNNELLEYQVHTNLRGRPIFARGFGNVSGDHGKIMVYAGLPRRGSWIAAGYTQTGEVYASGHAYPELGGSNNWDNSHETNHHGVLAGSSFDGLGSVDPIIYRDNRFGFSGLGECGGPTEPAYNSFTYPGLPLGPYDSGAYPCPDGPPEGATFTSGGIWRARMALSPDDPFLVHPPRPISVIPEDAASSVGDVDFVGGWGGDSWVRAGVADLLLGAGVTPYTHVSNWLAERLPIAKARFEQARRFRWQFIHLRLGWYGEVGMRYQRGFYVMRGSATTHGHGISSTHMCELLPNIVATGINTSHRPIFPVPARIEWEDGTSQVYLQHVQISRLTGLHPYGFVLQNPNRFNSVKVGQRSVLTLNFDGITIPSYA